jgi:MarR family transcriptional regulator, organic hydroperoxide resistance regulator
MTSRRSPPHAPHAEDRHVRTHGSAAKSVDQPVDDCWATAISLCFSVRDWWSALCQELDLTPSQGMALRSLDRPLPMSTLAEALACDASNVTGIVDRLEARGLIERRPSPTDRRVKLLVLTGEGARLRETAYRQMSTPPPAIAALPLKHKRALRDALRAAAEQADEVVRA